MRVSVGDFRLDEEEHRAVAEVMASGRVSEGLFVRKFEEAFAKYIGTKYCVAMSSGTSAMMCGFTSLINDERYPKIKPGAKVLVSPVTYISSVNSLVLSGLKPIFVDIDPRTFTLLPDQVEKAFNEHDDIAIILPVHLMGYPNDMDRLNEIAKKHGAVVFEDSAQAHGSVYKGKKTGNFSVFADFSFYIAHNIQAGEMGALVTDDEKLWKLAKKMKTNGRLCDCKECTRHKGYCPYQDEDFDPRFTHDVIGYNFKTTEFQASLALGQMDRADQILSKRLENVRYLNTLLEKYSDRLELPCFSENVSYLAYPIIIKDENLSRQELMRKLEKQGVETRPLFGCIPTQQPAYSYLKDQYVGKLPNADKVGSRGFYIGCHQYLEKEELEYVGKVFKEVLDG